MKKIVITGGPCVGKTTIIEILKEKGFAIVPEAARMIITEEKAKGTDILPSKNISDFQELVAIRQIELENQAEGEIVFLDRSLVDGHAYCQNAGITTPSLVTNHAKNRYDKVFILDPLGIYIEDGVRSRSLEDADKIHAEIIKAYTYFGYNPIMVPVMAPEERVDAILKNI